MHRNQSSDVMIGGGILVIIASVFILRGLDRLFNELEQAFNNFGHMASSFVGAVLWGGALLFSVVASLAGVFACIYFLIKYMKMVQKSTELKSEIYSHISEIHQDNEKFQRQLERQVHFSISGINEKVNDALKKPELLPPTPEEIEESKSAEEISEEIQESGENIEATADEDSAQTSVPLNSY